MTEKVSTLTVILRDDMRVDDVQAVIGAIRMLREIVDVKEGVPADIMNQIERSRLRSSVAAQVFNLIAGQKVLSE